MVSQQMSDVRCQMSDVRCQTSGLRHRTAHARSNWRSWTGSNRRPPACKAGALPTELQPPDVGCQMSVPLLRVGISEICHLSSDWWVWMDSNHRPPPYQDGALTN